MYVKTVQLYPPHHMPIGLASWAAADPLRPLYACPRNWDLTGLCRNKEACTPPLCLKWKIGNPLHHEVRVVV